MEKLETEYGHCEYKIEEESAHIDFLFIKEDHRGNGHGWDLLDSTIEEIKKTYSGTLTITAEPKEETTELDKLIGLYEDMGFEAIDTPSHSIIMEMEI